MPTLFDSHDEFNEWFSKDIETHVERQSGIDEGMKRTEWRLMGVFHGPSGETEWVLYGPSGETWGFCMDRVERHGAVVYKDRVERQKECCMDTWSVVWMEWRDMGCCCCSPFSPCSFQSGSLASR